MKTEDYISKGELELYVLDMLSEKEKKQVEERLSNDEIREEKQQLEAAFKAMATAGKIVPRKELRGEIISKIESRESEVTSSAFNYMMAASISLALLSSVLAFWFWNQWQTTEQLLETTLTENSRMAENSTFTNQRLNQIETSLAILSNPEFSEIILNGVGNTINHKSHVYWNEETKETYLQVVNLSELSKDSQYQLWSIQEGQPVNAGTFDLNGDLNLIKMKNNEIPQAFAITIEPRGGSESPTLEKMVVMGNVPS